MSNSSIFQCNRVPAQNLAKPMPRYLFSNKGADAGVSNNGARGKRPEASECYCNDCLQTIKVLALVFTLNGVGFNVRNFRVKMKVEYQDFGQEPV